LLMADEVCNHLHTKEDVCLVDPLRPRHIKVVYLEMLTREVCVAGENAPDQTGAVKVAQSGLCPRWCVALRRAPSLAAWLQHPPKRIDE
jgi:hypothetical protein